MASKQSLRDKIFRRGLRRFSGSDGRSRMVRQQILERKFQDGIQSVYYDTSGDRSGITQLGYIFQRDAQ